MRVTGGLASNRILKVPKGLDVRPTPDLVKQAIFNSLGDRVLNAKGLELFAGTGALSLEALSRGAERILCVEKSGKHARVLRENAALVGLDPAKVEVRVEDAFTALAQLARAGTAFHLILADPPYGEKNVGRRSTSFAQRLLDNEDLPKVLLGGGVFVLGHTKRDTLEIPGRWLESKMLKHGDTVIRFFNKQEGAV